MVAIVPVAEAHHLARMEEMRAADKADENPGAVGLIDIHAEAMRVMDLVRRGMKRLGGVPSSAALIQEAAELEMMYAAAPQETSNLYVVADRGRGLHTRMSAILAEEALTS